MVTGSPKRSCRPRMNDAGRAIHAIVCQAAGARGPGGSMPPTVRGGGPNTAPSTSAPQSGAWEHQSRRPSMRPPSIWLQVASLALARFVLGRDDTRGQLPLAPARSVLLVGPLPVLVEVGARGVLLRPLF